MNIAALGTSISFAKFIFLPHRIDAGKEENGGKKIQPGFWLAMVVLLGGLIVANFYYLDAYTSKKIIKALVTLALGWLAYWFIFKKSVVKLPRGMEKLDHLIGVMSLMLILLFWIVWTQFQFSI